MIPGCLITTVCDHGRISPFFKSLFFSFVEMKRGHCEIGLERLLLESEHKREANSGHEHAR